MKINLKSTSLIAGILLATSITSCKKNEDGVIIENTFTGNVAVTSIGADPGADFTGNGDSGTYSFGWNNDKTRAEVMFDITSPTGSVQIILEDKKGKEVFNQTINGGNSIDSFSGISGVGKSGVWKVSIVLTDFNGDGSYDISPVD